METRQLEYFVAVAEEASFTRGAARVFAAQSSVSAGIRSLESELGVRLFERSTKRVALSAAGEALLPEALRVLEGVDRVRSSVAATGEAIRGRLRIGTFTSLDAIRLPDLAGEFHRRHPLVDLQLVASPSGSSGHLERLRHGAIDVAFSGLPFHDPARFEAVRVSRAPFVAVLPEAHALAGRDSIRLADLAGERWIDAPAGFASRYALDARFRLYGLERMLVAEAADAGEIPRLVAAGLGVAAVPEVIYRPTTGVVVKRLSDDDLEFTIDALVRVDPAPAAAAFVRLLRERLGDERPLPADTRDDTPVPR